jgi:hypothetical protein
MESAEEPPQWGTFPMGPVEVRIMLALVNGMGDEIPRAFRDLGATQEARDVAHALHFMRGPEYDAIITYAAAAVLPRVMGAFASGVR